MAGVGGSDLTHPVQIADERGAAVDEQHAGGKRPVLCVALVPLIRR
jgi:hypothetical protein